MTDAHGTRLTAADVSVGDAAPEVVIEDVDRQDFVQYAGASGDFNPIHYDEPYAKEAGNESVFGQGMLVAGYAAHAVADWLGLANVTRYEVRFETRLWPGDTVTAGGEILEIERHADGSASVVADVWVTNHEDAALLSGTVEAELPAE